LHLNIRQKIILSIYAVLFPVLIMAGTFIYLRDYQAAMNETAGQYQRVVQRVDETIAYLLQDMADISVYFCINADILKILTAQSSETPDSLFWTNETPMGFIRDNLAIKSHIRTLILYPENGLPPFYVSHDASVHSSSIGAIRALDMYDAAVKAQGDVILGRVETGSGGLFLRNTGDKILVCREIFDLSKQRRLAFLAMSMDVSFIEGIYKNALILQDEAMVMLSADKKLIAAAGAVNGKLLDSIAHYAAGNTIGAAKTAS
jgi:two-component system sensor histidine kinase YesM